MEIHAELAQYIMQPEDLHPLAGRWPAPLAILLLDDMADEALAEARLPACPLIAVGAPSHKMAQLADIVIEPPMTLQAVAAAILAHPKAAAVTVLLLREIPALSDAQALHMESLAYAVLQSGAEHVAWRSAQKSRFLPPDEAPVLLLDREGDALNLTLNRPQAGNSIHRPLRDALREALELALADEAIKTVHVRGSGKAFSLGAELAEFGTLADPAAAHLIRAETLGAPLLAQLKDRLIVHIQGACVGSGLEIAAWGSRVIASEKSWFQLPELSMGILPGAGGCVSLTRKIGRQRAGLLFLSGRKIHARTALAWGLADQLTI